MDRINSKMRMGLCAMGAILWKDREPACTKGLQFRFITWRVVAKVGETPWTMIRVLVSTRHP